MIALGASVAALVGALVAQGVRSWRQSDDLADERVALARSQSALQDATGAVSVLEGAVAALDGEKTRLELQLEQVRKRLHDARISLRGNPDPVALDERLRGVTESLAALANPSGDGEDGLSGEAAPGGPAAPAND